MRFPLVDMLRSLRWRACVGCAALAVAIAGVTAGCDRTEEAPSPPEATTKGSESTTETPYDATESAAQPVVIGRAAPSVGAKVDEAQTVTMDVEVRRGVEGAGGERFRQKTRDETSKETLVLAVDGGAVVDAEISYVERRSTIERDGHQRALPSPLAGRTYRIEVLTETPDDGDDRDALNVAAAEFGAVQTTAGVWLDVFYPKRAEPPTLDALRQELETLAGGVVAGATHGGVWLRPRRDRSRPDTRDQIRRDRFLRPDATPMPNDRVHPPAAEVEAVVRDNPSIGLPNPMHAMLPDTAFARGVEVPLETEAVARFFGNGRAAVTVDTAALTLDRVDDARGEAVFSARFLVTSSERDALTMILELEGELAVTLDEGWLTRADLEGTVSTDAMQPVDGVMTRLHSEGTVSMVSRAEYGRASAARLEALGTDPAAPVD